MALEMDVVTRRWPFLYHLTAACNLPSIRETRVLHCANSYLPAASRHTKRYEHEDMVRDGRKVRLRDQKPLHKGNIAFDEDWAFEDVVHMLNEHVFFWPGQEQGPNPYGLRHFKRYAAENPAVLRVATKDLIEVNSTPPRFCRYNSGAPRCTNGARSPRGASTFLDAPSCSFPAHKIVEVVFVREALLPAYVMKSDVELQHWIPL